MFFLNQNIIFFSLFVQCFAFLIYIWFSFILPKEISFSFSLSLVLSRSLSLSIFSSFSFLFAKEICVIERRKGKGLNIQWWVVKMHQNWQMSIVFTSYLFSMDFSYLSIISLCVYFKYVYRDFFFIQFPSKWNNPVYNNFSTQ